MTDGQKKGLAWGVVGIAVVVCGRALWNTVGGEAVVANERVLKDKDTGKLFPYELKPGLGPFPHENPKTGKRTLYPVEWCFNGKCNKKGGTAVTLNHWLDKQGPTRCPVCGSLVRFHNPRPVESEARK